MTALAGGADGPWEGAARKRPWAFARAAAPDMLPTEFAGGRWAILRLALVTALLTLLTLGVYRFWTRTRLRRWYWSAVRPGGHPLEYTGDPIEKLLGFLFAVVVLAFYLGLVNLALMFASLAVLESYVLPTVVTSLGLVPMIFYARYRARRYVLARTRWRGVRFGQEPGALGYALRALMHWAITIASLGILWPRMTYHLEKYRTDRTMFGTARLEQGGRWQMLLPGAIPVWAGVILAGVGVLAAYAAEGGSPGWLPEPLDRIVERDVLIALLPLGLVVAVVGAVHYVVRSFRLMAEAKVAHVDGRRLGLRAAPRTRRVLGIAVLGNLLSVLAVVLGVVLFAAGAVGIALAAGVDQEIFWRSLADLAALDIFSLVARLSESPAAASILLGSYVLAFFVWGAARQAFVAMPMARHYALTLSVTGAGALPLVRQSGRDEAREAGGLAEALDLGGAL